MNPKTRKEISQHLNECYEYAQKQLGCAFDQTMAELSKCVLDVQYKCKEDTSYAAAAMLLSMPDETWTDEEREEWKDQSKFIKATIVWNILNRPEI